MDMNLISTNQTNKHVCQSKDIYIYITVEYITSTTPVISGSVQSPVLHPSFGNVAWEMSKFFGRAAASRRFISPLSSAYRRDSPMRGAG